MINNMHDSSRRLLKKITRLKSKLHDNPGITTLGTNEVINAVAMSNEITSELKEILIILHTTTVTEFTEAKLASFAVNMDIIDTAEEIVQLQNDVINHLVNTSMKSEKPNSILDYLTLYKAPISAVIIIVTLWALTLLNSDAMSVIIDKIPTSVTGVK